MSNYATQWNPFMQTIASGLRLSLLSDFHMGYIVEALRLRLRLQIWMRYDDVKREPLYFKVLRSKKEHNQFLKRDFVLRQPVGCAYLYFLTMNALMPKARRPKFALSLKIIDLNNVPLVSGTSFVKWHLPTSTAAEHRGRTEKSAIKEHKVCWDYEKIMPVRLTMDKQNMLQECNVDFEVIQDYNSGARGEKITLGHVSLNLAEYVEISDQDGEDGITRRYLMQESKINSTLKIGISMKQVDGERNFIAPALKTAPVFGGITGIVDFEQTEDDLGHMPALNRSREAGELQDVYRTALAASWGSQAGELRADQCIEDIFSGGDGWGSKHAHNEVPTPRQHIRPGAQQSQQSDEDEYEHSHLHGSRHHHQYHHHHNRTRSSSSSRSMSTITGKSKGGTFGSYSKSEERSDHVRVSSRDSVDSQQHGSSSESSERERMGFKHAPELDEFMMRDDLRAWKLPGSKP